MNDFVITGLPGEVFAAFGKFKALALDRGVLVNVSKTHLQQAAGLPSDETLTLALHHDTPIVSGTPM